jgi:hypothetical protein
VNRPFQFDKRSHLFIIAHKETFRRAARQSQTSFSFLASYAADCIRDTLPIIPLAPGDERGQRLKHLLFTKFRNEFFKL